MNSIVGPIFNIFLYVNSTVNSNEQYINSDFYPLHNEPYEVTIHVHKKKKKNIKLENMSQDSAESKRSHTQLRKIS